MTPTRRGTNPFKPGAGHSPPFLAGREAERAEFLRFLEQDTITSNVVLTGLRGVGKTVLMDDVYKPLALAENWIWVGSDFSESAFVDEASICRRLLTDLSAFTSTLELETGRAAGVSFTSRSEKRVVDHEFLGEIFDRQPGLNADKLKATLEWAWNSIKGMGKRGILFAYDEAQVVQDRKAKEQYPLALLLETFQSLQRRGVMAMLLLTGLPTLFPKLVESRTYAERMFKVQEIGRLPEAAARQAIVEPLKGNEVRFTLASIDAIVRESCGYPYFLQFICREAYDILRAAKRERRNTPVPIKTIVRKLDSDFFVGRWAPVPDRQRELLYCIACLDNAAEEFTVNQIVESSQTCAERGVKPFKQADVSSMLPKLVNAGLIYKNRHGRYLFAVPLMHGFVRRQFEVTNASSQSLFE